MKMPEVSVIMTAFQAEDTIETSIVSVLEQSYTNFELIIINDDPNNHNLKRKIEKFRDNRIQMYTNAKNSGVSISRNKGIKLARGKYIAFIDSDDLWHRDKLKIQINFMKKSGASFTDTSVKYISSNGIEFTGRFVVPEKVSFNQLEYFNSVATSSVIIERSIFSGHFFKNDNLHEDYLLWLEVLRDNSISVFGIKEYLLTYRIQKESKSSNKLKSIMMNFGVHRELGDNTLISVIKTISHMLRAFFKYYKILKNKGF